MNDSLILRHYAHLQQEGTQGFASPPPQTPFFFNAGAGCVRCLQEELLAERALRQAAEAAFAALREEAQADRDALDRCNERSGRMIQIRKELQAARAEERQTRERVENDYRLTCESWTEDYQQMSYTVSLIIAERDQTRAALVACEARLAAERLTGYLLGHDDGVLMCQRIIDAAMALIGRWGDSDRHSDLIEALSEFDHAQKDYQVQQAQPALAPVDRIAPEDRADGPACG